MGSEKQHIHLFSIRCTLLAFHALVWSFISQSKPEFYIVSTEKRANPIEFVDKHLEAVMITGAVFIAILGVFTLMGSSLQSSTGHFVLITTHSIGIILVIISILNYWDVLLLWIPCVFTCILPTVYEIVYFILKVTAAVRNR